MRHVFQPISKLLVTFPSNALTWEPPATFSSPHIGYSVAWRQCNFAPPTSQPLPGGGVGGTSWGCGAVVGAYPAVVAVVPWLQYSVTIVQMGSKTLLMFVVFLLIPVAPSGTNPSVPAIVQWSGSGTQSRFFDDDRWKKGPIGSWEETRFAPVGPVPAT